MINTPSMNNTRLPLTSESITADTLAALRELIPAAFTEGKIDFERLKQALGESIQTDRERYGLNWAGKSDAIHALQSLSVGTLQPQREESVNFDTTENLIIEGDNLEVLKLLQKSYFGKIKMIYIDPPYNTGNEFIYPDNFREGLADYLRYSGQMSAEGTANTSNRETNGRYHSKWLSMMYPRLFLAKNLLCKDGVIFISIDDHEVSNLALMANEIFGEENFVANVIWQKKYTRSNDAAYFSNNHDHILVYAKSKQELTLNLQDRTEEQEAAYSNPDSHSKGVWKATPLHAKSGSSLDFSYKFTNGVEWSPPAGTYPRYSSVTFKAMDEGDEIWFGMDGRATPSRKTFLSDAKAGVTPITIWLHDEVGHTHEANNELKILDLAGIFDNPKPTRLIQRMLGLTTNTLNSDIILDFFAGSGTTAQAVLAQNKEDGGNRKFILVQLPEATKHKQFPTIADITRERVRRFAKKMNGTDAASHIAVKVPGLDSGFKAFRLDASNFKIWGDEDGATNELAITQQLELFADNLLPDATPESILFEILLKSGYDLNISREEIVVAGQSVQSIADGSLLVCLGRSLSREAVEGLIARAPKNVICLDEAFHGDDALLTNTLLQMQNVGIIFQTI